jgi:hypothetical protein
VTARWGMLADLIADDRAFYGLDGSGSVWAMDRTGETRWASSIELPANRSNSLVLTPDGYLLAWSRQDHAAWVIASDSGEVCGRFGGIEPAGAEVHHLDLLGFATFAACADGTFVGVFEERLVRFGRDGVGLPMWPGASCSPLYAACPERPADAANWDVALRRRAVTAREVLGYNWHNFRIDALRAQPLAIAWNARPSLTACPDGSLIVRAERGLARFDARGERVFARQQLPIDDVVDTRRACCDRAGFTYVLGEHRNPRGSDYFVVVRVSPDGATIDEPVRDARLGGTLAFDDIEQFAVMADGTVAVAGNHGRFTVA